MDLEPSDDPGSLRAYLEWVAGQPLLDAEEEGRLMSELRSGDRAAAAAALRRLAGPNQRLVVSIARKYAIGGGALARFIRVGNEGLERAIARTLTLAEA